MSTCATNRVFLPAKTFVFFLMFSRYFKAMEISVVSISQIKKLPVLY